MERFWKHLLAAFALMGLACAPAAAAVEINDVTAVNVGTSTFSLLWTTSEMSVPGLDVYSDAAGTASITGTLGIEYYPLSEGDISIQNDAVVRNARRALQALLRDRRLVLAKLTGLAPGATYYVRPRSFAANGTDNGTSPVTLKAVTTLQTSGFVRDARLLRIRFPGFAAEGLMALLQGPSGTTPLASVIGDGTDPDTALFALPNVGDTASGSQAIFASSTNFAVRVLGAGAPSDAVPVTIAFGADFQVAKYEVFESSFTSPAPFFTAHPASLTVTVGQPATFSAAATGTPAPTLQWRKNGAPISGETKSSYTIASVIQSDAGTYDVLAVNSVGTALSAVATLTVDPLPSAPQFAVAPADQYAEVGQNGRFSVTVTGTAPITYRWQVQPAGGPDFVDVTDEGGYAGSSTPSLTIPAALQGNDGDRYRCVATNTLGTSTSPAATLHVLAVIPPPSIVTQPLGMVLNVGENAQLSVSASGTGTLTYQWQKDGINLPGANATSLSIPNVQLANAGRYRVVVTASGKSTTSNEVRLSVIPPGFGGTHVITSGGYQPGENLTIGIAVSHDQQGNLLRIEVPIPAGWTYVSDTSTAQTKPEAGATGTLVWIFSTLPPSPVAFDYTLAVPAGSTDEKAISATAIVRFQSLPEVSFLLKPEPLLLSPSLYHTADTNKDWRIGVAELLRVIELYETRHEGSRTGAYRVDDTAIDGFAPDASVAALTARSLARYHKADTNQNGTIELAELTRVVELFNTRSGAERTGAYHRWRSGDPTGLDGFAPGP